MSARFGLVLGAGGTVGMAYHSGVLHALEQEGGIVPGDADLIVGTSAGSVIGSLLRHGWTAGELWQMAHGTHPSQADVGDDELARRRRELFRPTWRNPTDLARRLVGSAYVAGRLVARAPGVRVPGPRVPAALRRAFPGGIFTMAEAERRMGEVMPPEWPERPLWLCAVDIRTGRRVVFGRQGAPEVSLHRAVLASCAIPGVYEPVRLAGMTLVDGGAHSSTNLDLAAKEPACTLVLGVAPMAYDPLNAPGLGRQLVRRFPSRALRREVTVARDAGAEVLLLRPSDAELRVHGANLMRPEGAELVAGAAYDATARQLGTDRFRRFFERLAERDGAGAA